MRMPDGALNASPPSMVSPYRVHFTRHKRHWGSVGVLRVGHKKHSPWLSRMLRSYGIKRLSCKVNWSRAAQAPQWPSRGVVDLRTLNRMSDLITWECEMTNGTVISDIEMDRWVDGKPWRFNPIMVVYDFITMQAMSTEELTMAAFDDPLAALVLRYRRTEWQLVI